jgi:uncharacterized protein YjiS (DUF1127 family)
MAARIRRLELTDEWRAKIQTSMLLNRLSDHALGNCELSTTQIKAIEILIRKTMPDLQAVQMTAEVDVTAEITKIERVIVDPANPNG